jgi:hypothetical protein
LTFHVSDINYRIFHQYKISERGRISGDGKKRINSVDVLSKYYGYGTLKPVKVNLRRG